MLSRCFPIMQVIAFRSAVIQGVTFKTISPSFDQPAMMVQAVAAFTLSDTLLEDINGTQSTQNSLITLQNLPTTATTISGLKLIDSWLSNRKIIQSISSLQTLSITDGEYSNCLPDEWGCTNLHWEYRRDCFSKIIPSHRCFLLTVQILQVKS